MCWENKLTLKCVKELGYSVGFPHQHTHLSETCAFAQRLRKQENFTEILLDASFIQQIHLVHTRVNCWSHSGRWPRSFCPVPGRLPGKTGTHPIRIRKPGWIFSGSKQRWYGTITEGDLSQTSDPRTHSENHEVQGDFRLCRWSWRNCICVYTRVYVSYTQTDIDTHTHFTFHVEFLFHHPDLF